MNFSYSVYHNVAAYLETTQTISEPYRHAINYLRGSRVSYALTANTPIYEDHQREFWDSIVISEDKQTLSGTIANRLVTVNEAIIREVLQLGNADSPTSFSPNFVRETILLMGYPKDLYTNDVFKKYLCPQWRFIAHTYLQCMTHLQAAWDRLQNTTVHPFIAIVRNRPFNFSNWIFQRLVENLSPTGNRKSCLLFPRYLQLIFNHQRPDLPRTGNVLSRGDMQCRVFKGMEGIPRVPDVLLLPHMIGENLPVDLNAAPMDEDEQLEDEQLEDEEYQPEFTKEELVAAAQEYWSRRPAHGPLPDYFSSDEDDGGDEFQGHLVDNSLEISLLKENTEPEAINLDRDDILPCPPGQRYTLRSRQDPAESEEEEIDDAENAKEVENDNDNDGDRADKQHQHIVPTRTHPSNRRVYYQPEDTDDHVVLQPQVRDGDEAWVTQEDEAASEPPPLTSAAQTPIITTTTTATATTIQPLHTIPRNPSTKSPTSQTTIPTTTTTQNPPITTTTTTRRPPIIPSHRSTIRPAAPFQASPSSSHQGSPSLQPIYDRLEAQDAIIQAQSSIIDKLNCTIRAQDAKVESLQAQLKAQVAQGTTDPFIIDTIKEQHSTKISQLQVQIDILFKALTGRQAFDAQQKRT